MRNATGFDGQHQDGDDKHVQHGPLAEVRYEFVERPRLVGRQPRIKPQSQQRIVFHEWKTDGEHEQDQKQKQFPGIPQNDESTINGDLVFKQPQLGHGSKRQENASDEQANCRNQHQHNRPAGAPVAGYQWRMLFHKLARMNTLQCGKANAGSEQSQADFVKQQDIPRVMEIAKKLGLEFLLPIGAYARQIKRWLFQ